MSDHMYLATIVHNTRIKLYTSIVDFFQKKGKFYNTCIENRNKEFLDYI